MCSNLVFVSFKQELWINSSFVFWLKIEVMISNEICISERAILFVVNLDTNEMLSSILIDTNLSSLKHVPNLSEQSYILQ